MTDPRQLGDPILLRHLALLGEMVQKLSESGPVAPDDLSAAMPEDALRDGHDRVRRAEAYYGRVYALYPAADVRGIACRFCSFDHFERVALRDEDVVEVYGLVACREDHLDRDRCCYADSPVHVARPLGCTLQPFS